MPIATDRVTFEGRRTTRRTADMVKEARRISGLNAKISQGGYNAGGVAASAGTHDRDALDFATASYTVAQCQKWEDALWKVGFAAWWRRYMFNVWPQHHHGIPKGGDLSRGAAAQERAFRNQRDGLAGNRGYGRIGSYASQTWEKYKEAQGGKKIKIGGKYYPDIASVSTYYINASRRTGAFSRHVWYVQVWLNKVGLYKAPLDGRWGPKTQAAMDAFRRTIGLSGNATKGSVGITSLGRLRANAGSTKKIRTTK